MSAKYASTGNTSHLFDDDVIFSPEMDSDALEDRLEQARQNRTTYYRKMLASRNRPLDDYAISKRTTYSSTSGGSPASKEASISDSVPASLPKMPEPHSSWRFYTSYDNGEWRRHAVPVDHDEEEILREAKKIERGKHRDTVSPTVDVSHWRSRQAGGPLLACIQPRQKRLSEGSANGHESVNVQMVNGHPVNGSGFEVGAGQLEPAGWIDVHGDGNLVPYYQGLGGFVFLEGEPVTGGPVKQEFTSKYMSTVTVTQPPPVGQRKSPGAGHEAGGGGGGASGAGGAKTEGDDGSGVRKSRRPRIYGFQEKIIIPTKYKNAASGDGSGAAEATGQPAPKTAEGGQPAGIAKGNTSSMEESRNRSVSIDQSKVAVQDRTVAVGGTQPQRASPGRAGAPRSQAVKVVVVNSGSDAENEKNLEQEEEEGKKEVVASKSAEVHTGSQEGAFQMPFALQEGAGFPAEGFKEFQETFRKHLEAAGLDKHLPLVKQDKNDAKPNQRVFSKDEQTFSEVGPDGLKRDGKVMQTYEVVTTDSTTDGGGNAIDDKEHFSKEIPIVRSFVKSIQSPPRTAPLSPATERRSTASPRVEIFAQTRESPRVYETTASHSSAQTQKKEGPGSVKTEDKTAGRIVEQTGSLFKQLSPRPKIIREKEFPATGGHRRWSGDETGQQRSESNVTMTSSVVTHREGVQPDGGAGGRASFSSGGDVEVLRQQGLTTLQPTRSLRSVEIVRDGGVAGVQPVTSHRTVEIVRETGNAVGQLSPSTGRRTVIIRETGNTGGQLSPSTSHRTTELVRETGNTGAHLSPSTGRRTVEIVRETGNTGEQPFTTGGHRTVQIVRETETGSVQPSTISRTVEISQDRKGHSSLWDQSYSSSADRNGRSNFPETNKELTGNGKTFSILETKESHTKPEFTDSMWEVQMAVKD